MELRVTLKSESPERDGSPLSNGHDHKCGTIELNLVFFLEVRRKSRYACEMRAVHVGRNGGGDSTPIVEEA